MKLTTIKTTFAELRKYTEKPAYLESSINEVSPEFYGFSNYEEMKREISKPFSCAGETFNNEISTNVFNDVCGFAPNVPAYLNGEAECMYNFETTEETAYHELNFYISISYQIDAERIKQNGETLARFLQKNTTSKDKFKVTFFNESIHCRPHTSGNGLKKNKEIAGMKHFQSIVEICNYEDYMTDEIYNLLCSPALYRLYILSTKDLCKNVPICQIKGTPVSMNNSEAYKTTPGMIDFMDMQAINHI